MNWYRIIVYDLKKGLFRWRYLTICIVFALPCLLLYNNAIVLHTKTTFLDYVINYFTGVQPIKLLGNTKEHIVPMTWLLIMGSSLLLNLDYLLGDLTKEGQQIICRCSNRRGWFLSKCLWNIASCVVFFCAGLIVALLFAVLSGGTISINNTPELTQFKFQYPQEVIIDGANAIRIVLIDPLITIIAINLMQMTLSLYIKPIYSYLTCIAQLLLSIYYQSPLVIGSGAMVIRGNLLKESGFGNIWIIIFAMFVALASIVLGLMRIKRFDIYNLEE